MERYTSNGNFHALGCLKIQKLINRKCGSVRMEVNKANKSCIHKRLLYFCHFSLKYIHKGQLHLMRTFVLNLNLTSIVLSLKFIIHAYRYILS